MKTVRNCTRNVAAAVLIVFASATIAAAAAGDDECAGVGATIGGTCTPLTNATSGSHENAAFGFDALESNTSGRFNTATGTGALKINTSGSFNTADGAGALQASTGGDNTAAGTTALGSNEAGSDNTAIGSGALGLNTTGSDNIGIGFSGGGNLSTGDHNIDIGNGGIAGETGAIRIGTQGMQTATFIAGIFGTPKIKKACQVVVETTGQVGCVKSSLRYKHDIRDMGDASDKLMKLRPVTFQYKQDSDGIRQYGLIAEEVEKVYPELVIEGDDGRAETVEYQVLPALLLNEVQKQARTDRYMARQLAQKDAEIAILRRQVVALQKKNREIDTMNERLDQLERQARVARPDRLAASLR